MFIERGGTKVAPAVAMHLRIAPSLLALVLVGAAGAALFFPRAGAAGPTREAAVSPKPSEGSAPNEEPFAITSGAAALPPNHPALGNASSEPAAAEHDQAALDWTQPSGWETAPNRSNMRLATYRVPGAAKGSGAAELTVTRAGGSAADNIARWVGQFEQAEKETRTTRTIAGFHVTTLEVSGTYDGGMSTTAPEATHPGWSLLAAVVETNGPFYFFKMVGPSAAVRAAKPAFDALLSSVRKPS